MKLLIVDDEPLIVETIRDLILHDFDFEVVMAGNGLEAYEKVTNEKFDLILTDHRMPKMTGLGLIQAIRDKEGPNQKVPIIMISAYSDEVELELNELENTHFQSKPIKFDSLMRNISMFTGQKFRKK